MSTHLLVSVLGGEGNSKLKIRRKRGYEELLTLDYSDAIAEDQPTKFVIEITNGKINQD